MFLVVAVLGLTASLFVVAHSMQKVEERFNLMVSIMQNMHSDTKTMCLNMVTLGGSLDLPVNNATCL